MLYRFEPLDVALFRDGRPFSPDDMNQARSLGAVPSPRTLYGVIRGMLLQCHDIKVNQRESTFEGTGRAMQALGSSPEKLGELWMFGPWVTAWNERGSWPILPCPADVIKVGGHDRAGFLRPSRKTDGLTNARSAVHPLVPCQFSGGWSPCGLDVRVTYEPEGLTLAGPADLPAYLSGEAAPLPQKLSDFIRSETHMSHEREPDSLRPRDGRLYSVEFLRAGFDIEVEFLRQHCRFGYEAVIDAPDEIMPEGIVLGMGGERRPFRVQRLPDNGFVKDAHLQGKVTRALENSFEETACKLRLYLLTPALFEHEQGWIPDFICPATLKGERDGIQYELIAAALPRAIAVSGWDMVKRQPRLGRRLVPAGSVYFLKARSDTLTKEQFVQALLDSHWFKSIVSGEDERKMGFGVTLIGGFDYAD